MARSSRSSALVYAALLSTATVALVMGCAQSTDADLVDDAPDASAEAGKKDARPGDDTSSTDDDEDSGSNVKTDAGTKGTDADAGDVDEEDKGGGAGDAGGDASDAGGATDAGDAGSDAGGDDAGDSGTSTATKPVQGEIVISEVMYNPSGTETVEEWVELHNTAASPRLLSGLVLRDGASPVHSHTIRPGLVIEPGAYVVLASSSTGVAAAKVPAAAIVYDYNTGAASADTLVLGNSNSGSIVLLDGATEIARAKYGALGLGNATNGQSIQLKTLTYAGAAIASSWCKSSNEWAPGADKGTPGAPSDCN